MITDIEIGKMAKAVSSALGIRHIRNVCISEPMQDVTEVTITFIATKEQLDKIGVELAKQQ